MAHRLDGKFSKYKTKDCGEECPHYKHFYDSEPGRDKSHPCYMSGDEIQTETEEERCNYGVAWKHLMPMKKPKHCEYFRKETIKITK